MDHRKPKAKTMSRAERDARKLSEVIEILSAFTRRKCSPTCTSGVRKRRGLMVFPRSRAAVRTSTVVVVAIRPSASWSCSRVAKVTNRTPGRS